MSGVRAGLASGRRVGGALQPVFDVAFVPLCEHSLLPPLKKPRTGHPSSRLCQRDQKPGPAPTVRSHVSSGIVAKAGGAGQLIQIRGRAHAQRFRRALRRRLARQVAPGVDGEALAPVLGQRSSGNERAVCVGRGVRSIV
jgi:hypothetical protein